MLPLAVVSELGRQRSAVGAVNYGASLAVGIILLSFFATSNGAASTGELKSMTLDDVKMICRDDKKINIGSVSQMNQVINAARIVDGLCRRRYMASLGELEAILRAPREELCGESSFEAVRSYHFRFISPMRSLNKRLTQFEPDPKEIVRGQLHPEPRKYSLEFDEYNQILMIPIAVRHFWLSFMLQLSAQCKRNLLDNLKLDVAKYLGQNESLVMDVFSQRNPIGHLLADGMTMINFDNVLYMPELEGEIKGANGPNNRQVFVKTEANESSSLYGLVTACQTRFKPIYEKLLMPVIRLAKLGYDYQGDKLTEEEKRELLGPETKSWLGLVNVCEMFDRVIVLHKNDLDESGEKGGQELSSTPEVAGNSSGLQDDNEDGTDDKRIVTITREEAEELMKQANENDKGGQAPISGPDSSQIGLDNGTIEYTPTKFNRMDDELWITKERQLDLELSRKVGNPNPFGFKSFLRRVGAKIRKDLSKLDPDKFASYRRNSLWWSGVLNLISSITNFVSTSTTATFVILAII